MRLRFGRIEKAAARFEDRPVLTHVFLRIKEVKTGRGRNRKVTSREGWLEATDSFKFARVPVEVDEDDVEGLIPVAAIEAARSERCDEIIIGSEIIIATNGKRIVFQKPEGTWPAKAEKIIPTDTPVFTIGLNTKLLRELSKALGSDQVQLDFTSAVTPIKVTSQSAPGAEGVLMPIQLDSRA